MQLLQSEACAHRHRHRLPPLRELLASAELPEAGPNKVDSTMEVIRHIAECLRSYDSVPFYSMREFQTSLGVALRTVAIAFERLEVEGLLVRFRGSHTRLTGTKAQPMTPIRGVVGWLECMFTLRHYDWRRAFSRGVGDAIRRSHFVTDTILHWEDEEAEIDFAHRILARKPDVAVWFQPTKPHRQTFETLKENGIRNLIICDRELDRLDGQVLIDWRSAYAEVLDAWKQRHRIRRVLLVEKAKPCPMAGHELERMARERGLTVSRVRFTPDLPAQCVDGIPAGQGIVLMDERTAVDFCQPETFLSIAKRHRLLFARDLPCIPFAPAEAYDVDSLCYPMGELVDAIREVLLYWQAGEKPCFNLKGEARLGSVIPAQG